MQKNLLNKIYRFHKKAFTDPLFSESHEALSALEKLF